MAGQPIYQDGRRVCERCRHLIYAGSADRPELCSDCIAADDAAAAAAKPEKSDAPLK